jgi:hypothetical protein
MRTSILVTVLTMAGCAVHPPASPQSAERHAANVAAAHAAGYEVSRGANGSTLYCAPAAATGSHIAPACLNESAWERKQLDGLAAPSTSVQTLSGRPSDSGTLGR